MPSYFTLQQTIIWKAIRKKRRHDRSFRFVSCDPEGESDENESTSSSRSGSPSKLDPLDGVCKTEDEPKRPPILQMTLLPNGELLT